MTLHTRLRFEEPPPKSNRPGKQTKHERIASKLIARPGEWACIGTYSTAPSSNSIAHMIRHGKATAYQPAESFEAVSRLVNGEHRVYARYVGPGGEHA